MSSAGPTSSASAAAVPGVTLLNVDPGADTNRTVITFVGEPEAVLEGVESKRIGGRSLGQIPPASGNRLKMPRARVVCSKTRRGVLQSDLSFLAGGAPA